MTGATGGSRRASTAPLGWVAAALLCAALYWPGLGGPLVFDDLTELEGFLDPTALAQAGPTEILLSGSGPLQRPVARATFWLSAAVSGAEVHGWKLFNLALHLATAGVLYLFLARLVEALPAQPGGRWLPALATTLWLLHPLQVSTVLYTVQRMTQLAAVFVLAGLYLYASGRLRALRGRPGGTALVWVAFLVGLPLAALSKENGLLLVPLALVTEAYVFRLAGDLRARRTVLGVFVTFAVVPSILGLVLALTGSLDWLARVYDLRPFDAGERLLTELRVLVAYLLQLLVPAPGRMPFFYDDLVVSTGWLSPPATAAAAAALVAMGGLAWWTRRRAPLVSYGIVFFFVAHSLESTVAPLELVFEHRNYLPAAGVALAVVAGIGALLDRAPAWGRVLAPAAALALAVLTSLRVSAWSSEESIYAVAVAAAPDSERAVAGLAEVYTHTGRRPAAIDLLERYPGLGPGLHRAYLLCIRDGRLPAGLLAELGERPPPRTTDYPLGGLLEIGRRALDGRCEVPVEEYLALASRVGQLPTMRGVNRQKLLLYEAQLRWAAGDREPALALLDAAHAEAPESPVPLFLAVEWLIHLGRNAEAEAYLGRARARVDPRDPDAGALLQQVSRLLVDASPPRAP